jgi:hypothetical protein
MLGRPSEAMVAPNATAKEYDVALSCAGEDQPYVERVAVALRARSVEARPRR